jgi:hypothetical protein
LFGWRSKILAGTYSGCCQKSWVITDANNGIKENGGGKEK